MQLLLVASSLTWRLNLSQLFIVWSFKYQGAFLLLFESYSEHFPLSPQTTECVLSPKYLCSRDRTSHGKKKSQILWSDCWWWRFLWDQDFAGIKEPSCSGFKQAFLPSPLKLYLITSSFPPILVLIEVMIFPVWVELGCKVVHGVYAELYNPSCFNESSWNGRLKLNIGVWQSWNLVPDTLWRCSWLCAGRKCRLLHQKVKTGNFIQNFKLNPYPDDKVLEVFGKDYLVFI